MAAPSRPSRMDGAAALLSAMALAACGQGADTKVPEATQDERSALDDAGAMIAAPTPGVPDVPVPGGTPSAGPAGP